MLHLSLLSDSTFKAKLHRPDTLASKSIQQALINLRAFETEVLEDIHGCV